MGTTFPFQCPGQQSSNPAPQPGKCRMFWTASHPSTAPTPVPKVDHLNQICKASTENASSVLGAGGQVCPRKCAQAGVPGEDPTSYAYQLGVLIKL